MSNNKSICLTPQQIINEIDHVVEVNRINLAKGLDRVTLCIEGDPGLGKTALVRQYAKRKDMGFFQLNTSMIEEVGDLTGYPIKEYEVKAKTKSGEIVSKYVAEASLESYTKRGYASTGNHRMGYALPQWLSEFNEDKPSILYLDDVTRGLPHIMQALMQVIQHGEYLSWKLPDNCTIIMSSNPSDGDNNVTELDKAQSDRFMMCRMKYSPQDWAKWAEKAGIDGRCINFMLLNREAVVDLNDDEKIKISPRSWVYFFLNLVTYNDYSANLHHIQRYGEMTVGNDAASLFVQFIHNKLDQLIEPEHMLKGETEKVIQDIRDIVKEGVDYRADIASTLGSRFINYTANYAKDNPIDIKTIEHIGKLFDSQVFGNDVNFNIVHNLFKKNSTKFRKLLSRPKVLDAIM